MELIDTLSEEQQAEVVDFANFLKHHSERARILASDKEKRIAFDSAEALLNSADDVT